MRGAGVGSQRKGDEDTGHALGNDTPQPNHKEQPGPASPGRELGHRHHRNSTHTYAHDDEDDHHHNHHNHHHQ